MNRPALKVCPFCGCTVHWEDYDGVVHDEYREDCFIFSWPYGGELNCYPEKDQIIKVWNTRVEK